MSDDTSIDLLVFQIIAEREHGSLVATHEPSALESTQEVTLCTFDEISEIWFDDKDINQALVLVQPRRFFIQKMLTQHHSNCQSFSIYLTLPDYLSEFEVPVKVHDLFGELYGYIQSVQAVQSIQISDKISQGITIFCVQVDLSFKRSQFDLLVHTEPGVMDLVLPRQEVYELGIIEELRKSQHIYKMDVGKRNGCFRINLPDDVVSIRIYCSSSSLEVQKAIFRSLQPIFDAIKYTAVKECQIKNCTPWNDDEFIIANGHSATVSAIDLRSFQDEDISEVMNILVQLRIFFYFMSGKRLVVYGNGSNLVRLRLELLPFNVHLPIGQKQGASQFTLKKLSLPTHNEMRFAVKIGRVGSFHTVPVQIAIAELAEDLESGNLYESQSVKCLREQFQAQEFHIQWIESGTSNEKCLCFELDKEYEDRIPLSVDTGISLTRITHRGPCSQPIRVGVVNKPSENRHDHWNTVFKKMSNKGDHRKNHLAFSKHSSGSIQRYNAIKSFSLDENFRRTTLIIGNEEAPFFFSDKVQVSHLGSLFDIENKVLSNWNDRSSLEYAKWDTKDRVELDVLTHSKNFYRIAQFLLPGGQEFSIARPLQRNGKWVVRHADKLILRTFEKCYITIVCPPNIDHAQILYGKVSYDCTAAWILKHFPGASSTTKNVATDKSLFENMLNTKSDEQSVSDNDNVQGGEASIHATLIDATDMTEHTVGVNQPSTVVPDSEEKSKAVPKQSNVCGQSHNSKDVNMAESSKLDDAMFTSKKPDSHKTGRMTTCVDDRSRTDADTSMLVEAPEVKLPSKNDSHNAHIQHTDVSKSVEDELDPISSFSPVIKNSEHEKPPVGENMPPPNQVQAAANDVRLLASPQHARKKTYIPEQGNQRRLEDLFVQNANFAPAQHVQIHSDSDDDNDVSIVGIKECDELSKKKNAKFGSIGCENVLVNFRQAKEKTGECLKIVEAWPSLFANREQQLFAKRAACYLLTFASTMCYAVTALRILSFAPWTDKHFLGHIREIALCAIAKGWTHRNPNTMVSKNRVTTADICVAISSYDNENVFPPGEVSELDQTILEVCSDLFPQHVQEFYSQFQFDCFSCQESIAKNICLFDADAFQWTIPSDICLQEICTKMTPRYHFDKDGLKHKSDCCNNDAITFSQVEHGHLMIVIFRQELANLPSVSNCCHLLHQQIELDYLRSDACGNGQQQMPIVSRQYQCSALIVCQTSDSASCNHFYLVEDQKNKEFQVFDNLKGLCWQKKHHVAAARVYGIVLRTHTKKSTRFKFDPTMYQLPDLPNSTKTTNKSKKKTRGICTRSYLNGISRSKQLHKRNTHEHVAKPHNDPNIRTMSVPRQHCSQNGQSGSTANGGNYTDEFKRKPMSENCGNQKDGSDKNDTTHDAPIQAEHPDKKSKIDVEMRRESPAHIAVVSLFDGVSSVLPAITEVLGGQPAIFVGAECDQTLRHLVSEKHGFRMDGQWKKHPSGMSSIYIDDVKKLFADGCRILSQMISIAGRECKWIFVSGSPCQDLTIAGSTQGIVGICGKQSSLLFYVHLAIWYIQTKYPAGYVRFLAENAGSMQDFQKIAIKEILGLEHVNDAALRWDTSVHFGIRRERFFFRNYDDCGKVAAQEYSVLGEDGFGPLRNTNNQPIALGPLLRVRDDFGNNMLRLSWTAYQPISLLWDYSFWVGDRKFATLANLKQNARLPSIDFTLCLPPLWFADWKEFLTNMYKKGICNNDRDSMVMKLLPMFCSNNVRIPFRTLTTNEVLKFAGLAGHFDSIQINKELLTDKNIRDFCGNSFHPALIKAALGSKEDMLKWLDTLDKNGEPKTVATPSQARMIFHRVMDQIKKVVSNTQNMQYLKQAIFDPMPELKIAQLPELSEAELPVISMQSQLPHAAAKPPSLVQRYNRIQAGPFSEATKQAIRLSNLPIDITTLPFYGYGVYDRNNIVKFFLGDIGSRWHRNVAERNLASIAASQARFASMGNGLQKLLIDVTTELCKMRLPTQVILVHDFQEGSRILTIGSTVPRWIVYCIWDPIRKFFYLDTVAWNAYGPVPGNWDVNLVSTYVAIDYQQQQHSILFPIIVNGKKKHCLFSGHGVVRVCDECQFCTRESDIETACHYHSSAAVQPLVYRAIGMIDDNHQFQIVQTESAPKDQLSVWRVLIISAQHASQVGLPIEPSFSASSSPCHLQLAAMQKHVNSAVQVSRFQHFDQLWSLFSQGTDHFEEAWYQVVVAYVWNLPMSTP